MTKFEQVKNTVFFVLVSRCDSGVVGLVTRLRTGRAGTRIPEGPRVYFPLDNVNRGSGAQPHSHSMGTGVLSPRREVNRSPLSFADIKNEWNTTSTPQYAFQP
jgi:hypothetical protein